MFDVYQEVVGDYGYRLKVARRTYAHVTKLAALATNACVACEAPPPNASDLLRIPRIRRWALFLELFETLSPLHDPHRGRVPQWILDWFEADEAGRDMTTVLL
jgi:hypothetical protein